MTYFREKMRTLRREYTKKDRKKIIAESGNKCCMCERKTGDIYLFGPTHYLKKKIRFKVAMDIHVIEGMYTGDSKAHVVICNGCHMSYHLFNRLSESAEFGNKALNQTNYKRCTVCQELNCMCCARCSSSQKWCSCNKSSAPAKTARKKSKKVAKRKKPAPKKCEKHPYYRAIRRPWSGCRVCMRMYKAKNQ